MAGVPKEEMMGEWQPVNEWGPEVTETGYTVELLDENGKVHRGKIVIDDWVGYDEAPIFKVDMPDGLRVSPFEYDPVRFTHFRLA